MIDLVFTVHFAACLFMCGVIWIIQVLHYPAFADVSVEHFARFHRTHTSRITYVVAPAMLLELATGAALLYLGGFAAVDLFNFGLLLATWLCTFALSVPRHNVIARQRDLEVIRGLVLTNWPRTALWSVRALLLVWGLIHHQA